MAIDRSAATEGPLSSADTFVHRLGLRLRSVEIGRAAVELKAGAEHCNDTGAVHGGAIFTLADAALAAASNARMGEKAVAITGTIDFLLPARAGDLLVAEAVELWRGGRRGSYAIQVHRGESLVAAAMATTLLVGRRTSGTS